MLISTEICVEAALMNVAPSGWLRLAADELIQWGWMDPSRKIPSQTQRGPTPSSCCC